MKIFIPGQGSIQLSDSDFIYKGGEAKVYGKGDLAYKIYWKKDEVISLSKIKELQVLDRDNIIKPLSIILDHKNIPIGFSMLLIEDNFPFPVIFSNAFRRENNIAPEKILELVENIMGSTDFIHSKDCLVIDGNETNYLLSRDLKLVYFIDVNNYQTKSFPGVYCDPSIRDWNTKGFNKLTDWYSFAIIACKIFVGVHPFRGNHPDFPKTDIVARMKANVSIFNKKSTISNKARDFSNIPSEYFNWFIKLFEDGKRLPPPKVAGLLNVSPIKTKIVRDSKCFDISLFRKFQDDIMKVRYENGELITKTKKSMYIGKIPYPLSDISKELIISPRSLTPVLVGIVNQLISITLLRPADLKKLNSCIHLMASDFFVSKNSIFLKHQGKLVEISIDELAGVIIPCVKSSWNIMSMSSYMFDSIVVQDVLGDIYLTIPIVNIGKRSSYTQIRIPELDSYRIVAAKYDNYVCMLTGNRGSVYSKILILFDKDFTDYQCIIKNSGDYSNINFTSLDCGICASINDDGSMEIFENKPGTNFKKIEDPDIKPSMTLCKYGSKVLFYETDTLFSISSKKGI